MIESPAHLAADDCACLAPTGCVNVSLLLVHDSSQTVAGS